MNRYMIVPLILLTVIATINFQGFVEYYRSSKRVNFVLIGAIGVMALFLFNHSRLWRNHLVQNQFDSSGPKQDISQSFGIRSIEKNCLDQGGTFTFKVEDKIWKSEIWIPLHKRREAS